MSSLIDHLWRVLQTMADCKRRWDDEDETDMDQEVQFVF